MKLLAYLMERRAMSLSVAEETVKSNSATTLAINAGFLRQLGDYVRCLSTCILSVLSDIAY